MTTRKTKKLIYNTIVLALLAAGIAYVCSRFVHPGNVEYTDNAQVKQHITPVNTRVQGFIKKIYFEEYKPIHKGDTLLVIENTEKLLDEDAVTRQQYDNVKTTYESIDARYEQAIRMKHSTSLSKNEQTHRLGQNDAAIRLAQAAVDLARLNLSYTVIVATCDGTTGHKDIHEGQLVQPGQTMVSIVDNSDLWVIANYRETQLPHIKEGAEVAFTADAVPGVVYKGVVESISEATGAAFSLIPQDNATGNFVKVEQRVPVRIRLKNNNTQDVSRLRAGFNVECEIKY